MPRPKTKPELLDAAATTYAKLTALWDGLSLEQAQAPFPPELLDHGPEAHWQRDRCLRDVVIHLHEWHKLVLAFVQSNRAGNPASFFPEPYTWRNYAGLNRQFVSDHQATGYQEARELLAGSHEQVLNLIETFSNEELFTKKYFPWTGTTSLGSYFVSSTSSHYEWAAKKTRLYVRALRARA